MKSKIKHYWVIVIIIIIANIWIFSFFSKKLESFVINQELEKSADVDI